MIAFILGGMVCGAITGARDHGADYISAAIGAVRGVLVTAAFYGVLWMASETFALLREQVTR